MIWDIYSFLGCAQYAQGMLTAQSYLEKTNEVLTLEKKKTVQVKPKTKPEVSVKEGTKSKL